MTDYEQFLKENGLTEADMNRAKANIDFLPFSEAEEEVFRRGASPIAGEGIFARVNLAPLYISARARGEWTEIGRYMNHSENPNCQVGRVGGGLIFFTSEAVAAGEELTVNYRDVKNALGEQLAGGAALEPQLN